MAHTPAAFVRDLGGLLFDRRCLGWDTAVLLNDCADIRALQIIGADCADLKPALDKPDHPRPAATGTSVQLYRSDPRVCARVVLWGDADSLGAKPQMIAVDHQISQAAATFKI